MVPRFSDRPVPEGPRGGPPLGSPGEYRLIVTLSRPGYSIGGEYQVALADAAPVGTSHLKIPASVRITLSAITLENGETVEFLGIPNDQGFLGRIESSKLAAASLSDAYRIGYNAVTFWLSSWSAQLDVPLRVQSVDVVEVASGIATRRFRTPFNEVPFTVATFEAPTEEFRPYAALYREALGSDSPSYQFLCFYKISEGLLARRTRLAIAARARGAEPARISERLPADEATASTWLDEIYFVRPTTWDPLALDAFFPPEYRGMKVTRIVSEVLRPLRVKIAHATSIDGEPALSLDNTDHVSAILDRLPLARCIARRLLRSEFPREFLPHVRPGGLQSPPRVEPVP